MSQAHATSGVPVTAPAKYSTPSIFFDSRFMAGGDESKRCYVKYIEYLRCAKSYSLTYAKERRSLLEKIAKTKNETDLTALNYVLSTLPANAADCRVKGMAAPECSIHKTVTSAMCTSNYLSMFDTMRSEGRWPEKRLIKMPPVEREQESE